MKNEEMNYPAASGRSIKPPTRTAKEIAASGGELTRKRLENQYLDKHIYYGLSNLNDGFDHEYFKYFSESEFKIVLDRVEEHKLGIFGIEPRKDGRYYDVYIHEDYSEDPTAPSWYRKAMDEFIATGENLLYSATFFVPEISGDWRNFN